MADLPASRAAYQFQNAEPTDARQPASRRYRLARSSRNQSFGSGAEPGEPERRLQPAAAPTLAAAAKIPMRSGLARRCRLKPAFREQGCRVRMCCLGARNPRGTTRFPKILIDKQVCAQGSRETDRGATFPGQTGIREGNTTGQGVPWGVSLGGGGGPLMGL